jgi:hypothetical protein
MIKFTITFLIYIAAIFNVIAQRNPNTNAGKISKTYKYDSSVNNQIAKPPVNDSFVNTNGNSVELGATLNFGSNSNSLVNLNNGVGFGFKIGYNLLNNNMPISLYAGLGFDYLYFGGKKINQPNNVSVAINSNAYGWYPYLNLELGHSWPITLFGTAYWGGRFFYTRQNINYTDNNGDSQTKTKNLEGDVTQIYGIGGGLKIKVVNGIKLELRYQKNYGNVLSIIDPTTIQFDNFGNLSSYQNKTTDTDLDMVFIGVLFCF